MFGFQKIDPSAQRTPQLHSPNSKLHSSKSLTPTFYRVLAAIGAPLFVLLGCRWLLNGGGLYCLFRELTGLYCPGCGSGRAAIALLHGHIPQAVGYNPLLFLLGLPCGALLLWEYLRFVFPGLGLKKPVLPKRTGDVVLALVLGFWILRNLPGFAFLAP